MTRASAGRHTEGRAAARFREVRFETVERIVGLAADAGALFIGHLELIWEITVFQIIPHEPFLGKGFLGLILAVCLPLVLFPETGGAFLTGMYAKVTHWFGFAYLLAGLAVLIFLGWLALARADRNGGKQI